MVSKDVFVRIAINYVDRTRTSCGRTKDDVGDCRGLMRAVKWWGELGKEETFIIRYYVT